MKETTIQRLLIFETKILRRIFGPTKENQIWKIKINEVLDKLIKHKNIVNYIKFDVFSTVHHSIGLFLQPTLMHNSVTKCMSHYYPRHVSGLDMPILRRNNCKNTASGILALLSGCTLHRLTVDSAESALNRCNVQPLRRARIPDAVFVQLFLLRMGMSRPETCRG